MIKMVAMPTYGKNLKNLLLWNWWADFNETLYVISGTLAHHNLINYDLWLTLTYFTTRSIFGRIGVSIEKVKTLDFS